MESIIDKINRDCWHDWSLNKFEINYDRVIISLLDDIEATLTISCSDYIGFSFVGHWDESVIEEIKVETYGNLIDESLHVVKMLYSKNPLPGGGIKKIDDIWYQVNIKLIDGNIIKVACKNIQVEGLTS